MILIMASSKVCRCGHPELWHTEEFTGQLDDPKKFCGSVNGICGLRRCSCIRFRECDRESLSVATDTAKEGWAGQRAKSAPRLRPKSGQNERW